MDDLDKTVSVSDEELVVFPQAEEVVVPDEVLPAEEAPKLTAEQIKAINVAQSARLVRGNPGRPGTSKIGVTRSTKKSPRWLEKKAKESRKKNQKIANKKFRPSGSKKRK